MKEIQQVLLIPARKLLQPDNDPIASAIPEDARRRLLELDPFITHLDEFFPDSGADLTHASNPFADPSPNNRAELIGRWWLDGGTIISYAEGESYQLISRETNEVRFTSGATIDATVGVNFDDLTVALGIGLGQTTTVGLQSSKENDLGVSKNAACFLIHNQNERDLDGIELYFDKIFSTFMFRRLRARRRNDNATSYGAVSGTIYGKDRVQMGAMNVRLVDDQGNEHQTSTRVDGSYSFYNLPPGHYTLIAGDQQKRLIVSNDVAPTNPVRFDIDGVRRPIDLHHSPVWELTRTLRLPSDTLRKIVPRLPADADLHHLGSMVGADKETVESWMRTTVVQPRRPPPPPTKGDDEDDTDDDRRGSCKRGKRK
jgi:hypothetical protein